MPVIGVFMAILFTVLFASFIGIDLNLFFHNVPIIAKVDNKIIYKGVSACVRTESAGNATRLVILDKPYCFKSKESYVSRDVKIIPQSNQKTVDFRRE